MDGLRQVLGMVWLWGGVNLERVAIQTGLELCSRPGRGARVLESSSGTGRNGRIRGFIVWGTR